MAGVGLVVAVVTVGAVVAVAAVVVCSTRL